MTLEEIKTKADTFFYWPNDNRESVTYHSAMLFALDCVKDADAMLKAREDRP